VDDELEDVFPPVKGGLYCGRLVNVVVLVRSGLIPPIKADSIAVFRTLA
jgi:hypothetical protein